MKSIFAPVTNVKQFAIAGQKLMEASVHTPRIGVAFGPAGAGKTRTLTWWTTQVGAANVSASSTWRTLGAMLRAVCEELNLAPRRRDSETLSLIIGTLARSARPRPLVIDEADWVVRHTALLDGLREIHDKSAAPVVLIGMHQFVSKILSLKDQEQFVGRISQVVEFKPYSREDTALFIRSVSEVEIADDLIDRLHAESGGNARALTVALEQIERYCQQRGGTRPRMTRDMARSLTFSLDRRPDILARLGLQHTTDQRAVAL